MKTKTTQEPITLQWLLGRGWTIIEASERIGCSTSHLTRVLSGKRPVEPLAPKLRQLPRKKLTSLRRTKKS